MSIYAKHLQDIKYDMIQSYFESLNEKEKFKYIELNLNKKPEIVKFNQNSTFLNIFFAFPVDVFATSSGVPFAIICPPKSPPSGPKSIM